MSLTNAVTAAKERGIGQEQIASFLNSGYVPQPIQLDFHAACNLADFQNGPVKIGFGGARGPGKTHASFAQVSLWDCQRIPNLKVLFLRKVGKAARESFGDLVAKILPYVPHRYLPTQGRVVFPNGSTIITGNYRTEGDIDKYLGLEYDLIVIEEATQLSETKLLMIEGSLRTAKLDWRPRMYLTTNPGGIGHGWFKKTFIEPWRKNTEQLTRFVHGTYKDNAFINPEYTLFLERLTGVLGRMWRDGDWDISAGSYFTNWDERIHVVSTGWNYLPYNVETWLSFDYGFSHPTAVYWHASYKGKIVTYAEHVRKQWLPEQHAQHMFETSSRFGRNLSQLVVVAGPDTFSQRGDAQGRTVAEQYLAHGIYMVKANADRISGASEMLRRLGNPDANVMHTWQIDKRCTQLIECLPNMQIDPKRPEDVLKIDADIEGFNGDDPYDSARYGLMHRSSDAARLTTAGFYQQW